MMVNAGADSARKVFVRDVPRTYSEDGLKVFFESERNFKPQVLVERVELDQHLGRAIVTFEHSEDVPRVLSGQSRKPCRMDGETAYIERYTGQDLRNSSTTTESSPRANTASLVQTASVDTASSITTAPSATRKDVQTVLASQPCHLGHVKLQLEECVKTDQRSIFVRSDGPRGRAGGPALLKPVGMQTISGHASKEYAAMSETEQIRIIMIGKTGVGKSTLGNLLLGQAHFRPGYLSDSMTKECQIGTAKRNGVKLTIVDTPGFFDTRRAQGDEHVRKEIIKALALLIPGFHAILFVIQPGKLTEENRKSLNLFYSLFGDNVSKYVYVVVNCWDHKKNDPVTIADYMQSTPVLKALANRYDGRVCACSNDPKYSALVDELLDEVMKMVNINGGHFKHQKYRDLQTAIENGNAEGRGIGRSRNIGFVQIYHYVRVSFESLWNRIRSAVKPIFPSLFS